MRKITLIPLLALLLVFIGCDDEEVDSTLVGHKMTLSSLTLNYGINVSNQLKSDYGTEIPEEFEMDLDGAQGSASLTGQATKDGSELKVTLSSNLDAYGSIYETFAGSSKDTLILDSEGNLLEMRSSTDMATVQGAIDKSTFSGYVKHTSIELSESELSSTAYIDGLFSYDDKSKEVKSSSPFSTSR